MEWTTSKNTVLCSTLGLEYPYLPLGTEEHLLFIGSPRCYKRTWTKCSSIILLEFRKLRRIWESVSSTVTQADAEYTPVQMCTHPHTHSMNVIVFEDPALYCCGLSFHLQCWHPILALIQVLVAPFKIQLTTIMSGKAINVAQMVGLLLLTWETQMEYKILALPDPAPGFVATWEINK